MANYLRSSLVVLSTVRTVFAAFVLVLAIDKLSHLSDFNRYIASHYEISATVGVLIGYAIALSEACFGAMLIINRFPLTSGVVLMLNFIGMNLLLLWREAVLCQCDELHNFLGLESYKQAFIWQSILAGCSIILLLMQWSFKKRRMQA